jgi:iron complex outermembrane recepter protein
VIFFTFFSQYLVDFKNFIFEIILKQCCINFGDYVFHAYFCNNVSKMKKTVIIFFYLLLLTNTEVLSQQCNYNIRGKIIHEENGEPIALAHIWIPEIDKGSTSDFNGNFRINLLCEGKYTLKITYLGHKDHYESITLNSNQNITIRLVADHIDLEDVEIHGHQEAVITTTSLSSIKGTELDLRRGESLGEIVKSIPGITTISSGATISKPVIHGLHSNRILILNNGVRLEGQQWGLEHAPEIDPFLAQEITVIKGAETVRFGPDAMGGVILINPSPLPLKPELRGNFNSIAFSNGRGMAVSGELSKGSKRIPGLAYRVQGSSKAAGNVQSPQYIQENTGLNETNFSGTIGYNSHQLGTEVYFSHYQSQLGILKSSHTGNLTDLLTVIENGRPFTEGNFSYRILNPSQNVNHQLLKVKSHYHLKEGLKVNFQYGFQRNNRKEFDRRRSNLNDRPSLNLELFSNTLDLNLDHITGKNWNGMIGVHLIQQANSNIPGTGVTPLVPNFEALNLGMYVIEKFTKGPLELEAGIRYDQRKVEAARFISRELQENQFLFKNISGFFGGVYAISPSLTFNSNLGTAWRPPNINEQFSQGLHHGVAAFEIGDPTLKSEKSLKWVNTLSINQSKFKAEFTGYMNTISDYIYLSPTPEQVISLRGTFNVFEYLQTDAQFMGMDFLMEIELTENLEFISKGSLVRAKDIQNNTYLPFIPADQIEQRIKFHVPNVIFKNNLNFYLANQLVARQHREPDFDLSPAPPSYSLWNIGLGFEPSKNLVLHLQGTNILNTEYKDYMNRFRYFTHDLGRNILLKINYKF